MPRIKKRGLEYFPIDIDFMQNRMVRRIMKREGDSSLATLINILSCIYGGEGYYVAVDELFYEDVSASLYSQSADDVKRIIGLAVNYGIFHAELFDHHGILTSADIQKQYLFSTRRRKASVLDARYRLIDEAKENADNDENTDECEADDECEIAHKSGIAHKSNASAASAPSRAAKKTPANTSAEKTANRLFSEVNENTKNETVTFSIENATSGTHSIAQQSIAKHSVAENSKEYPLLNSSPGGGTQGADRKSAGRGGKEEYFVASEREMVASGGETSPGGRRSPAKEWTDADIDRMQPPRDGLKRNPEGLILNLRQFGIPPAEQRAVILKCNFGIIGHPVWKGFDVLRISTSKIRLPGRYLLSLCQ